jgi:predicted histidine transporter YuiF (NhaC family)
MAGAAGEEHAELSVFMLIGQSNMAGRGGAWAAVVPVIRCLIHCVCADVCVSVGAHLVLCERVVAAAVALCGCGSPAVQVLHPDSKCDNDPRA